MITNAYSATCSQVAFSSPRFGFASVLFISGASITGTSGGLSIGTHEQGASHRHAPSARRRILFGYPAAMPRYTGLEQGGTPAPGQVVLLYDRHEAPESADDRLREV